MADDLEGWQPTPDAVCSRCHENPVGPGGILCPDCRKAIETRNRSLAEAGQ